MYPGSHWIKKNIFQSQVIKVIKGHEINVKNNALVHFVLKHITLACVVYKVKGFSSVPASVLRADPENVTHFARLARVSEI